MVRHCLVSCLPESLAPLPHLPAPSCTSCVEGPQRAAPHSSSFPPTTAPFWTLHLDVWGPSPVLGPRQKRYFLIVVDDYSRYTTVFPLRRKADVPTVLEPWLLARGGARGLCAFAWGSEGLGFQSQCVHFGHPSAGGCQRSTGDPRLILGKGYRHVGLGGYGRTDPLFYKPFYPNGLARSLGGLWVHSDPLHKKPFYPSGLVNGILIGRTGRDGRVGRMGRDGRAGRSGGATDGQGACDGTGREARRGRDGKRDADGTGRTVRRGGTEVGRRNGTTGTTGQDGTAGDDATGQQGRRDGKGDGTGWDSKGDVTQAQRALGHERDERERR
ncbi:unnamed protein product [Closterium sp. NIES-54]